MASCIGGGAGTSFDWLVVQMPKQRFVVFYNR
jgi:hypothetical protein